MNGIDFNDSLNKQQFTAVNCDEGNKLVLAGAGSGKTRVLTYKIWHLIKDKIYKPNEILALTFTNKAAREMKARIGKLVGEGESKNLWMGTFHSVFARILRVEHEKIGFPSNFTIYDTDDSKSLVRSIIKELNLDKDIYKVGTIRNRISSLKNNFITPVGYNNKSELNQQDKIAKRTEFGRIYQMYVQRCEKASAMDFDDLLLSLIHI